MTSRMRLFAEKVLLEAPGNENAGASNSFNVGGNFSSTFNTASNANDLNISGNLNANSVNTDDDFEVNTSFDDFDYSSDFNSPSSSSFGGSGANRNSKNSENQGIPNVKAKIQTITDYFPDEGTVELTNEDGKVEIKPIAQVEL